MDLPPPTKIILPLEMMAEYSSCDLGFLIMLQQLPSFLPLTNSDKIFNRQYMQSASQHSPVQRKNIPNFFFLFSHFLLTFQICCSFPPPLGGGGCEDF